MLPVLFPKGLKKAFTLSYDDGCYDDLRLIEMMKKYRVRGTFNVSSGLFRPEGQEPCGSWERMTKNERKSYNQDFLEVAVHGVTHRDFTRLSEPELIYEISGDKHALEDEFGIVVRGGAYPYGSFDDRSVDILRRNGIKYCRTVWSDDSLRMPQDWLRLRPTAHHNDEKLPEIIEKFLGDSSEDPRPQKKLLYIWGHTPEFRRDNNWNMMEDYLAQLSGHDDIWYATNIEICEYDLASRALEYSADGRRVYNPTAMEIWLEKGGPMGPGEVMSVRPGETVEIF